MIVPFTGTVTTTGDGSPATLDATGLDALDLTKGMFKLQFTIDDPSKLGQLSLFAGLTSSLADNIRWRFNAFTASSQLAKAGELTVVTLQMSEINTTAGGITLSPHGVPSTRSGFTALRLQVNDDGTGPITVQLLSTEVVPEVAGAFITIDFDDGNRSVLERAFPSMYERDLVGTHYTIVDVIGQDDRVTMDGLRTLAANGWEIAGHAYAQAVHTARYTGVTAAEAVQDLIQLRAWLGDNFPDDGGMYSFAYPGGAYEDTTDGVSVEAAVAAAGFATGRTILSSVGVSTHTQIDSLPPPMPYRLYGMSGISSLATPPTNQLNPAALVADGGMLDKLERNGGWMHLVFHRVVAGTPTVTSEISQVDFDMIMDSIKGRNITVATNRGVAAPLGQYRRNQRFVPARVPRE